MKSFKFDWPQRLIAFFLIAVLLICLVGFAANGWQDTDNEPDSGDVGGTTDNTDENTDGNTENTQPPQNDDSINTTPPETTPPPKYFNPITGLEVTEAVLSYIPFGFVMDTDSPLYGVAKAELNIEFPTENGTTRITSFSTKAHTLWKIGALAPTRDFITSMANLFGGVIISNGNDDILKYTAIDTSKIHLDISEFNESHFKENALKIYTSTELIEDAYKMSGINASGYKSAPYDFAEYEVMGVSAASTVILPFSASSTTELYYSEKSDSYLYFKNGNLKVDMLTGENIAFTNIFILFADTTTYEKALGTELVIDTLAGGRGYYISKGLRTEIRWNINADGSMEFKTLDGERLEINRGNCYISYFKASRSSDVTTS